MFLCKEIIGAYDNYDILCHYVIKCYIVELITLCIVHI